MNKTLQFSHGNTERGFPYLEFSDRYDSPCTLQLSSLADERAIWFGLDKAEPRILASKILEKGRGWAAYPIHEDVFIPTRMHLTQAQVRKLIPVLQYFADYGELPNQEQEQSLPVVPDLGALLGAFIHYCDTHLCDAGLCPAADICDGSGPCGDRLEEWAKGQLQRMIAGEA